MTKLLKILFIASITIVLVSCGGNYSSQEAVEESQIVVKEGAFYALTQNIEFNENSLKEITLFNIDCDVESTGLICEELQSLVEASHLLFINEDLVEKTENSYKTIEGEILLEGILLPGILKYNISNDFREFIGELTFLLKDQEIVIYIKGMM